MSEGTKVLSCSFVLGITLPEILVLYYRDLRVGEVVTGKPSGSFYEGGAHLCLTFLKPPRNDIPTLQMD